MNIFNIRENKEYILTHAYGQPNQRIKVLYKENESKIYVEYISNDVSNGLRLSMNTIECDRYLQELL